MSEHWTTFGATEVGGEIVHRRVEDPSERGDGGMIVRFVRDVAGRSHVEPARSVGSEVDAVAVGTIGGADDFPRNVRLEGDGGANADPGPEEDPGHPTDQVPMRGEQR